MPLALTMDSKTAHQCHRAPPAIVPVFLMGHRRARLGDFGQLGGACMVLGAVRIAAVGCLAATVLVVGMPARGTIERN